MVDAEGIVAMKRYQSRSRPRQSPVYAIAGDRRRTTEDRAEEFKYIGAKIKFIDSLCSHPLTASALQFSLTYLRLRLLAVTECAFIFLPL